MQPDRLRRGIAGAAGALAVCAWCGWLSGFHRRTAAALVTWIVSLAAVLLVHYLLWAGRRGRRPGWQPRTTAEPWPRAGAGGRHAALRGILPWAMLLVAGVAWDVLGLDTGPHEYHLTLSALMQAYRPLEAAFLLGWVAVGVGYGVALARSPRIAPAPAPAGGTRPQLAAAPALLLPSIPAVGVAFWVGLAAVAVALDLVARRSRGRLASAGDVARLVGANPLANVFVALAWGYAGYHLFAF